MVYGHQPAARYGQQCSPHSPRRPTFHCPLLMGMNCTSTRRSCWRCKNTGKAAWQGEHWKPQGYRMAVELPSLQPKHSPNVCIISLPRGSMHACLCTPSQPPLAPAPLAPWMPAGGTAAGWPASRPRSARAAHPPAGRGLQEGRSSANMSGHQSCYRRGARGKSCHAVLVLGFVPLALQTEPASTQQPRWDVKQKMRTRGHVERVQLLGGPPAAGGAVIRPHNVTCRCQGWRAVAGAVQHCTAGGPLYSALRTWPAGEAACLPAGGQHDTAPHSPTPRHPSPRAPIMSASVSRPGMRTISCASAEMRVPFFSSFSMVWSTSQPFSCRVGRCMHDQFGPQLHCTAPHGSPAVWRKRVCGTGRSGALPAKHSHTASAQPTRMRCT